MFDNCTCTPTSILLDRSSLTAEHLLGRQRELDLTVVVENQAEDAYEATVTLNLPPGVSYINIYRDDVSYTTQSPSKPIQVHT